MSRDTSDDETYARSLAHWSEDGRAEMEAFYEVATKDYRLLSEAHDWSALLDGLATPRILDVACGSGKFPTALARHFAAQGASFAQPFRLDLLDPSAFSIRETARVLTTPFEAGEELCLRVQDLKPAQPYPLVWSVHGLYAVPASELDDAVDCFVAAIAGGGLGFIAHAREEAHYVDFYRRYLETREGSPYTAAEAIEASLARHPVVLDADDLHYDGVIPAGREDVLEGYLQRCLFDDDITLSDMRADPQLGPYLEACRQSDGSYRFRQVVAAMFIRPS